MPSQNTMPMQSILVFPMCVLDYMTAAVAIGSSSPVLTSFATLAALLVPLLVLLHCYYKKMQEVNQRPFHFDRLPPELRLKVYENLIEDPFYPPAPPCAKHNSSPLHWMLSRRWSPISSDGGAKNNPERRRNFLFLANKQIYAEYMDVLCKKTTFHLTVSPQNYIASSTPTNESGRIWKIAPSTLKHMKKCEIKLFTTSAMLGVADPRLMKSLDWALARQMREELAEVENIDELNLHVKAIGDPLWNPLWVWYHASQSMKTMGSSVTGKSVAGPQLNRITFSLDSWSPGENYLQRDPTHANQWAWWCVKGHCLIADGGAETTVREFCARLYLECRVCRPDLESDEDGEMSV